MEFIDRVSAYPNRYIMTDGNGNASHVYLERADDPTVPGTPLNAENMNQLASKEYVDALAKPVLLWENASPLSSFAASEFTVSDPTKYNEFIVKTRSFGQFRVPANEWIHIAGINVWSNGAHSYKRSVYIYEEAGRWNIRIEDCYMAHFTGNISDGVSSNKHIFSVDNDTLIIAAVYGLKGVDE